MKLYVINCGCSDYQSLWDIQKKIWRARVDCFIPDVLLITEHQHVYTFGKTSDPNHLIASPDYLNHQGINIVYTDRGGGITYHGPGQLVAYPIISLEHFGNDIHKYLRLLEQATINMLQKYEIKGHQDSDFTGVWVNENKITSIGIKVSRWVTIHGVAINVSNDLSYFDGIIACGIFHKGVTSISEFLKKEVSVIDAIPKFVDSFCNLFSFEPMECTLEQLFDEIESQEVAV